MKTWLVPVCLIAVALIGTFVIVLAEHKTVAWMNPPAPAAVYSPYRPPTPVVYPLSSPPGAQLTGDTSTEPNFITISTNPQQKNAIFIQGNNNLISWQGRDLRVVDIILTDASGTQLGYVAWHDVYNSKSQPGVINVNAVIWQAQSLSPTAGYNATLPRVAIAPGMYKLVIIDPGTNQSASTDLSILPGSPIRIFAPVSGQVLKQGQSFAIHWIQGVDTSTDVGINLFQNGILKQAIGNVPNNGIFYWTVPKIYLGNNFTIDVIGNTATTSAAFTIQP